MSWLDILPSHERQKLREKLRSPKEYAKSRESIPNLQEIDEQVERAKALAELKLALELEPRLEEELRKNIERDLQEQGSEALLQSAPENISFLQEENFHIDIVEDPNTKQDTIALLPEGNPGEKVPLKPAISDRYAMEFLQGMQG